MSKLADRQPTTLRKTDCTKSSKHKSAGYLHEPKESCLAKRNIIHQKKPEKAQKKVGPYSRTILKVMKHLNLGIVTLSNVSIYIVSERVRQH